jgi:hypothetical protein
MYALPLAIRTSMRGLARTPWFSGVAILIVTLGIGAHTALFSLLDAVLFRSLP